jgi:gas vesicle protein
MVKMGDKSLFYGFLTGSLIGGAITLLATPKSGNDVQKLIITNVNELVDSLSNFKEKTQQLKIQVETVAKESASTIKTVSTDVQNSIKEWRKDVEPTITDIQNSIQELHETIDQLEAEIKKPLSK